MGALGAFFGSRERAVYFALVNGRSDANFYRAISHWRAVRSGVTILGMFRALLSGLFHRPETPSERTLRELGEKLAAHANDWRNARATAREKIAKIELLEIESSLWRDRLSWARESEETELIETAARKLGWYESLLDQARRELDVLHQREVFAHECLSAHRAEFLRMVADARAAGERAHDFGLGVVYDNAPSGVATLPEDDEGEFVARLIDRARASVKR
jgi:hypothetical protein